MRQLLARFLPALMLLFLVAGCAVQAPADSATVSGTETALRGPEFGFYDEDELREHYSKHGAEFGGISREEYLARAIALRDAPVGGDVLQIVRADTVRTRFNRSTGEFIAFDKDLSIRTFFRPNDGERYFNRQATRPH